MSVESTRETMRRYWDDDLSVVADDAVYEFTHNGREIRGRDAITTMLDELYRRSFEATFNVANQIVADGRAVLEGRFAGRHIGEWEGIAPTGREVDVPIAVLYELENDRIQRVRIYLQALPLYEQLGVSAAQPAAASQTPVR